MKLILSEQEMGLTKFNLEKCESKDDILTVGICTKYNFAMYQPKPSEVRIAFAGDSVTMGAFSRNLEQLAEVPDKIRWTDQDNGRMFGFDGFPYLFSELLNTHNKTLGGVKVFNYAQNANHIATNYSESHLYYPASCRFEQLKKSFPHIVLMMFGGMDTRNEGYSEKTFIQDYSKLIKEVEALPTKPIVFLLTPLFQHVRGKDGRYMRETQVRDNKTNKILNITEHKDAKDEIFAGLSLQETIYKTADAVGIPHNRVIDVYQHLLQDWDIDRESVFPSVNDMHPNLKGHGIIAQDIYNAVALSPEAI